MNTSKLDVQDDGLGTQYIIRPKALTSNNFKIQLFEYVLNKTTEIKATENTCNSICFSLPHAMQASTNCSMGIYPAHT